MTEFHEGLSGRPTTPSTLVSRGGLVKRLEKRGAGVGRTSRNGGAQGGEGRGRATEGQGGWGWVYFDLARGLTAFGLHETRARPVARDEGQTGCTRRGSDGVAAGDGAAGQDGGADCVAGLVVEVAPQGPDVLTDLLG